MDMNKKLTTTGIFRPGQPPQRFPEFDAHLNRMQSLAFRIGDQLTGQPAGTVAIISKAMQLGVVPFRGKIETRSLVKEMSSQEVSPGRNRLVAVYAA